MRVASAPLRRWTPTAGRRSCLTGRFGGLAEYGWGTSGTDDD